MIFVHSNLLLCARKLKYRNGKASYLQNGPAVAADIWALTIMPLDGSPVTLILGRHAIRGCFDLKASWKHTVCKNYQSMKSAYDLSGAQSLSQIRETIHTWIQIKPFCLAD